MRPTPGELLAKADLPAFLITNLANIRYVGGVAVSVGVIFVTPRRATLFVDDRYRHRAEQSVAAGVVVRDVADFPAVMRGCSVCGYEADDVTVARKGLWKKHYPNTKFIQNIGLVEAFRRQKSEEELRCLRRAQRITKELLRRVPAALRKDVTEEKLARQLAIWALELGADGLAFDPIVAFGTHTGNPHHQPTSRTLRKGHLVQIDVGARVRGYCADMSQVFFTAKPTPQQKAVYETLLSVQRKAMAAAKSGVTNHALDALAREVLRSHGLESAFQHALGHGVGLEIHEGITLSQRREKVVLLPGEVVTIEPGVYFPGKFGMRVEEMKFVE